MDSTLFMCCSCSCSCSCSCVVFSEYQSFTVCLGFSLLGAADGSHFLPYIYNHHKAEAMVTQLVDREIIREVNIYEIT